MNQGLYGHKVREESVMNENITVEQVNEFYNFLQGELPKAITMKCPPKLSSKKAFGIVWYLQEHLRILPDNFERCCSCGSLFNTNQEGSIKRNRNYCSGCE